MVFCWPISKVQKKIKLNVLCYIISVVLKFRIIFIFKKIIIAQAINRHIICSSILLAHAGAKSR